MGPTAAAENKIEEVHAFGVTEGGFLKVVPLDLDEGFEFIHARPVGEDVRGDHEQHDDELGVPREVSAAFTCKRLGEEVIKDVDGAALDPCKHEEEVEELDDDPDFPPRGHEATEIS